MMRLLREEYERAGEEPVHAEDTDSKLPMHR